MKNIEIIGMGMGRPSKVVTNDDLSKMVDTSDEWIRTRTGIIERRWCTEEEPVEELAVRASKMAIENAGISPEDISVCIGATVSARFVTPNLACVIQKNIGLREDIPVLDVNAACSGFIYSLEVARGLLNGNGGKYGLVVGCEQLSRVMDMTDRSTCVLFGDGCGAAVIKLVDEEESIYAHMLGARGGYEIMVDGAGPIPSKIVMEGQEVFKFAVDAIPKCIRSLTEQSGMTVDDVDQVVCHQANARIIDHVVRKLKADPGKFYKNLERYGNTSAASIPIALCELIESGKIVNGSKLMLVGFGGGLTWAGVLIRYGGK
ncbi:MAG: ketoacyl-ACP synthase III [Lachnospiraceae bacterium]|nr:ketoacyl-ACP synthase III [Lachnospiraceae bacterium]